MVIAQTAVEYGALESMASGFAATRNSIEAFIGTGNSKYLLLAIVSIIVLLLLRRRGAG